MDGHMKGWMLGGSMLAGWMLNAWMDGWLDVRGRDGDMDGSRDRWRAARSLGNSLIGSRGRSCQVVMSARRAV